MPACDAEAQAETIAYYIRDSLLLRRFLFNLWYFRRPPWDTGITPPELLAFLQAHPPGRALDLGCGTGTNLLTLARAGWEVYGVDYALRAVLQARRRLRLAGMAGKVLVGDVTDIRRLRGPFDLVLDIGCYHGLKAPSRGIYRQNLLKLLGRGGHFLMYAHRTGAMAFVEEDMQQFNAVLELIFREEGEDPNSSASLWAQWRRPAA